MRFGETPSVEAQGGCSEVPAEERIVGCADRMPKRIGVGAGWQHEVSQDETEPRPSRLNAYVATALDLPGVWLALRL